MVSRMAPLQLTLSYLEKSNRSSFQFGSLISHKGADLGLILLVSTIRKSHMGSPPVPVPARNLTMSDIEGQNRGHLDFES